MKRLTSAQLFAPPKTARKTKARIARAKLVIVAARERAAATAQPSTMRPMRPPTVLQRHRLAERLNAKSCGPSV
jgi:septum formation topological specificity factor MinE